MAATGFYRLEAKIVQRSAGHSTTAKAAYIHREAMYDQRTGELHDYTRHSNKAAFSGFYAPQNAQEWAQERESFWNAVEAREKRKDSQLAVEYVVAFPHQMSVEHVRYAAQDFIRENLTRKGLATDLAIHPPHEGDEKNWHMHILAPLREIDKNGEWVAKKKQFVLDPTTGRYGSDPEELKHLRERFAHHLNRQLERFGYDLRVDHRSYADQGIDKEPGVHLGKRDAAKERRGERTKRGDLNREIAARNNERTEARRDIAPHHSRPREPIIRISQPWCAGEVYFAE